MTYWLEDKNGEWVGDFATNKGIIELRDGAPDSLVKMLDDGTADEKLVDEIVQASGTPEYVVELLTDAEAPLFITDGCGED